MSPAPADILFLETTPGAVLIVLVLIAWIAGLADVIFRRPDLDRPEHLAWILLIVLVPIFGTGLYFVLRPREHPHH